MELEHVRLNLLAQHEAIRRLLDEVLELSRNSRRGKPQALREALAKLREAVAGHCANEEVLLRPLLATIDAWGAVRVELMDREHRAEHEVLIRELDRAITSNSPAERLAAARALSEELRSHMEEEEKHLLSPKVLTYDVVRTGQFTG